MLRFLAWGFFENVPLHQSPVGREEKRSAGVDPAQAIAESATPETLQPSMRRKFPKLTELRPFPRSSDTPPEPLPGPLQIGSDGFLHHASSWNQTVSLRSSVDLRPLGRS